eukprot:1769860-Prymnesium_polylepis.1
MSDLCMTADGSLGCCMFVGRVKLLSHTGRQRVTAVGNGHGHVAPLARVCPRTIGTYQSSHRHIPRASHGTAGRA